MNKLDNIHYSFREIDGYNKKINFIISGRGPGKTTIFWITKAYEAFKRYKGTTVVFRRKAIAITEAYIKSIQFIINKFVDPSLEITYKQSSLKDGVVVCYIDKQPFISIVALSIDVNRAKSLIIPNLAYGVFDEFIINPKYGEKYLPNEVEKFKEIYNTYFREDDFKAKMYFLGNPYTVYNPYFLDYGVDFNNMVPGTIQAGNTWVVQNYKMKPELLKHMLEVNPLYQEDEEYKAYALEGKSVNDINIRIGKMKNNYKLMQLISIGKQTIGIYRNWDFSNHDDSYYCEYFKNKNTSRDAFCFDFNDLMEGKIYYSRYENSRFEAFKAALRQNRVEFENPAVYNQIIEVYSYL